MSMQLQKRQVEAVLTTWDETVSMAQVFAESGLFADTKDMAKAVVKIMAGRELGIGPIASLRGLDVINGKIVLNAGLIAALIKRSGHYDYRVQEHSDKVCRLRFLCDGQPVEPIVTFTLEDAARAGLSSKDIWKKYPRNMLFNRAISNGAKLHCPDIFSGAVYTFEELNGDSRPVEVIDTDGEVLTPDENDPPVQVQPAQAGQSSNGPIATNRSEMMTTTARKICERIAKAKGIDIEAFCQETMGCHFDELSRKASVEFEDELKAAPNPSEREQIKTQLKPIGKALKTEGHPDFQSQESGLAWLRRLATRKWAIQIKPESITGSDGLPDDLFAEMADEMEAELACWRENKCTLAQYATEKNQPQQQQSGDDVVF